MAITPSAISKLSILHEDFQVHERVSHISLAPYPELPV